MRRYLVMNIGCLHCGLHSEIVGFYETESDAEHIAETLRKSELGDRRMQPDREFVVFDTEAERNPKYQKALEIKLKRRIQE